MANPPRVVICETAGWERLAPLSLTSAPCALALGASTLLEKQTWALGASRVGLWLRPQLEPWAKERFGPAVQINQPLPDEDTILINASAILFDKINLEPGEVWADNNELVAARLRSPGLTPDDALRNSPRFSEIINKSRPSPATPTRLARYPYDLIQHNAQAIESDAAHRPLPSHPDKRLHLAADAKVSPGVVFDTSKGPIIIESAASIGANSVIEGPAFIGPNAVVMPLTLIRPGSSIAAGCRAAGEISNSILSPNSNKSHYGYLGDSYVGSWVNLGAGTTTSNLKNTYGPITLAIGPKEIKIGRQFLGAIIGDHVKIAIATRLNTGSYVGAYSQIAASQFTPKFVPSFSFLTDKGLEENRPDKILEVMRAVFARRGRSPTPADESTLAYARQAAAQVEQWPAAPRHQS